MLPLRPMIVVAPVTLGQLKGLKEFGRSLPRATQPLSGFGYALALGTTKKAC